MGNLESFSPLTLQLTGHVDKRGSRITVAGFVVSQTSEVRLGFQINRLDGKGRVVFVRKSVKPSQPFEPGHLRTSWIEHEAGDRQRPFLYHLLGLVRDRSWARFVCYTKYIYYFKENFKLNFIHPPFLLSIRALRRIVSFAGFLKDFSFFLLKNLN